MKIGTEQLTSGKAVYSHIFMLLTFGLAATYNPSATAATATASVTANIIITMSVSTKNSMAFGDISAGSTSGSVTLSSTGERITSGGTKVNSATPATPAEFDAGGEPGATFSISMPTSVQLTNSSSDIMIVDNFVSEPVDSGQLDASGNQTVMVGATLHVGSQQAFGPYTGMMSLNVDYN